MTNPTHSVSQLVFLALHDAGLLDLFNHGMTGELTIGELLCDDGTTAIRLKTAETIEQL